MPRLSPENRSGAACAREMPTQDVQDFSIRSSMPSGDVLALDIKYPGYLDSQIAVARNAYIYGRLRMRYNIPALQLLLNNNQEPEIIKTWIAALVTPAAYRLRGAQPNDETMMRVVDEQKRVEDALKEAADSKDGLYNLPFVGDGSGSSITVGGPMAYSEASPYDWQRRQLERIRGCR